MQQDSLQLYNVWQEHQSSQLVFLKQ